MDEMRTLEATARAGTGKGAARSARRENLVPGVIYGAGEQPVAINVKYNELIRRLKRGKFMSTLLNVRVDGQDNRVICRAVQKDVVRDLPIHVDFQRLTARSRIKLYIPVEFHNQGICPGIKKGGVLNVTRHEVECYVTAGAIPEQLDVDLAEAQLNDVIKISAITLPKGATPTITDRDFVICSIATPAGFVEPGEEESEDGETESEA